MGTGAFGSFALGLVILGLVLAIAWIIMPFAIIGTKPILRNILVALQENNRLLREAARDREPHETAGVAATPSTIEAPTVKRTNWG